MSPPPGAREVVATTRPSLIPLMIIGTARRVGRRSERNVAANALRTTLVHCMSAVRGNDYMLQPLTTGANSQRVQTPVSANNFTNKRTQPLRTNRRAYLGMGFLAAAVGLLVLS